MTPEEKAKELIEKFQKEIPDYLYKGKMLDMAAKACSIILCDEMINNYDMRSDKNGTQVIQFYESVKSILQST